MALFDFFKRPQFIKKEEVFNNTTATHSVGSSLNTPEHEAVPVRIDYDCFEIDNNRLIKFKPKDRCFNGILVLPANVISIERKCIDISANHIEIYIPPTVTHIDDDPFRFVKFVTVYGSPGSYAEEFVRSHTGSLPTYSFESLDYPDTILLKYDSIKAGKSKYPLAIQNAMRFEDVSNIEELPITFPCILFCSQNTSCCDDMDNVTSVTVTIKMQDEGRLVSERKTITYSAHNVAHATTPVITVSDIPFEKLPEIIKASKDEKASRYTGMTADNWQEYLKQSSKNRDLSQLPIVQFGTYPQTNSSLPEPIDWYVLDEQNGAILLLSRNGIDLCQYSVDENLMVYPNKGKKEKWWEGAYRRPFHWKSSNLCRWLNTKFQAVAFTEEQKQYIKYYNKAKANVFCLSSEEYDHYLRDDPAAAMRPTKFALWNGARIATSNPGEPISPFNGYSKWWLRDTIEADESYPRAAMVWEGGKAGDTMAYFKTICVRPAIWVSTDYWKNIN